LSLAIAKIPGVAADISIACCSIGIKAGSSRNTNFWSGYGKINRWFFINDNSSCFRRGLGTIRYG